MVNTRDSKSRARLNGLGGSTPPLGTTVKLREAAQSAAHNLTLKKPKSFVLVYLYNHAQTYFSKNS